MASSKFQLDINKILFLVSTEVSLPHSSFLRRNRPQLKKSEARQACAFARQESAGSVISRRTRRASWAGRFGCDPAKNGPAEKGRRSNSVHAPVPPNVYSSASFAEAAVADAPFCANRENQSGKLPSKAQVGGFLAWRCQCYEEGRPAGVGSQHRNSPR